MRNRRRHEWKVVERPDLRIITVELWARAQATRQQVREAVAPKGLARGKSGKHHSKHLFSGFARCVECGGAMGVVSGGKGSPRFGCRKSWQEGLSTCTNRLTIRIKVAEPQILAKLQQELLEPTTLEYITQAVEREMKKSLQTTPKPAGEIRKRLDQERRKLQNLVTALEGGSDAPASILKAINDREQTVARLEDELAAADEPRPAGKPRDVSQFVQTQLSDLHSLLKTDPATVKAELGRLNLALTFQPTEAEPRPYYTVKGQCDLSALVFSFF
jgi:hypothetical protein